MRIKNVLTEPFNFEGISIPAETEIEIDDARGQRLLALYWHKGLELISGGGFDAPVKAEVKAEEVIPEKPIEKPVEVSGFKCEKCNESFKSKRALSAHKRFNAKCK